MECCQFKKVRSALRMLSERAPNMLAVATRSEFIRNGLAFAMRSELLTSCMKHSEHAPNKLVCFWGVLKSIRSAANVFTACSQCDFGACIECMGRMPV